MSSFPLYTILMKDLPTKDLTLPQKSSFVKMVDMMDQDGHDLVYALIKTYYIENEGNSPFVLPYNGKTVKKDMYYDIDNFPNELKQLLYKFSKAHIKKMKEDKKLAHTRKL